MSKIDWDKPIEFDDGTSCDLLSSEGEGYIGVWTRLVRVGGREEWFTEDGICMDGGFIRNTQPQSLHTEPQPDNFATESPIRAFNDWDVDGLYAIGKGFRPSLAHLTKYLDAMETKEGWRLVQILESATAKPSFVFRKV